MGGMFYLGLHDRRWGESDYSLETGLKVYSLVLEFKYKN